MVTDEFNNIIFDNLDSVWIMFPENKFRFFL